MRYAAPGALTTAVLLAVATIKRVQLKRGLLKLFRSFLFIYFQLDLPFTCFTSYLDHA
jgi:hypothetical protein